MPKDIFRKNAAQNPINVAMGGGDSSYKAKNPFQVPFNYGTAAKPLAYKKEMGTHPLKQTYSDASEITGRGKETVEYTSKENVKPVAHASGKEYGTTLYSYYTGQGMKLPSLQERAKIYEKHGLGSAGDYKGTREQNRALFDTLTTKHHTDIYKRGKLRTSSYKDVGPMGEDLSGTEYYKKFGPKAGTKQIGTKTTVDGETTREGRTGRLGDFFRGLGDRIRGDRTDEGKTRKGGRRTISYDEAGNKIITVTDRKGRKKKVIKHTKTGPKHEEGKGWTGYKEVQKYDKEGNLKRDTMRVRETDYKGRPTSYKEGYTRRGKDTYWHRKRL